MAKKAKKKTRKSSRQGSGKGASEQAATSRRPSAKRSGRGRRRNNLPWILGLGGALLLIALPITINIVRSSKLPGEHFRSQGNTHIRLGAAHPSYNSNPPTSGWHTSDIVTWGSYDALVPEERLVHNMEDGGVIIWYRLGTPEENRQRIQALEQIARGYSRVVITPREEMPTTYALTAWTRLQRFDDIDEEGMRTFLEAFEGIDHHVGSSG